MDYDGLWMDQVSDGLNQTAACASAAVYDRANGLVFVSYMTGLPRQYGESTGKLCLSVFPPSQPSSVRHCVLDEGIGKSRGLLATAHYLAGIGRTRVMFTTTQGEKAAWMREYDFQTDTVSPRTEVLFRSDDGDVRLDNTSYRAYLSARGFQVESEAEPIINKVSFQGGTFYTAISIDDLGYGILCRIEENVLVPFAVCPIETTYEFRYVVTEKGICAVYRVPPDDHGIGHCGIARSRDFGKTWDSETREDGIQSRPDVTLYNGRPLIVYNYKSGRDPGYFPPIHNDRTSVRILSDERTILELYSRYGIVEHETISIAGDLYMVFSNCPQALSTENGGAWIEEGRPVEQGKEAIQWMRLGHPEVLDI